MDERTSSVIKELKKYTRIKNFLIFFCFSFLIATAITMIFYAIKGSNYVTKLVNNEDYLAGKKIQKIMTNPRIKFEYKESQFYDIKASKAIHENNEKDILLIEVEAKGDLQQIKAGKLVITDSGNDLLFTEQPILIIKQPKS